MEYDEYNDEYNDEKDAEWNTATIISIAARNAFFGAQRAYRIAARSMDYWPGRWDAVCELQTAGYFHEAATLMAVSGWLFNAARSAVIWRWYKPAPNVAQRRRSRVRRRRPEHV